MQTKHTFLFTLILGLGWAGYLFGYVQGPDPASNGIFGDTAACATAGCHVGANNLNPPSGTMAISGLPANWTPGQTYPLTISISRTGAVLFGYQLSAVIDATNQQAGTLTAGNTRSKVITGGGIQYAEHSNATVAPSGTFLVNWTAPASASAGKVRFNLAGNAANGNIQNTGDFIFTRVDRIDPVVTTDNSVRAYTLVDRGGVSLVTTGAGATPDVGYGRIQAGSGSTTPAGVAIFGSRTGGVLVSETGVPASPALLEGRIYAEVTGNTVNTGLAIGNPNATPVDVSFSFTDAAGTDFGFGSFQLAPNQQIARFLNQDPFTGGGVTFSGTGTFSFAASQPIAVVALRSYINSKGDFLMSTLPVINATQPAPSGTQVLSHFADGGGWVTQILLVNTTTSTLSGTVQFSDDNGSVVSIGVPTTYSVPRRSSQKIVTPGTGAIRAGSVRVVPTGGGLAPVPLVVFTYRPLGDVVSEAGVPALSGTAFRAYAESSGTDGQPGNIQTGLAITNNGTGVVNVTLELTDLDGSTSGLPAPVTISVPGNGHTGRFLAQIFPTVPNPFKGVVRITSPSTISVVGLRARYNERASAESFIITTTPPTLETAAPSATELFFPDLVNGGGYTTQIILFSGSAGQASSGNLRFVKQDGTGFNLVLN